MRKRLDRVAEDMVLQEKEKLTIELAEELKKTCQYPVRYADKPFGLKMDQKVISPQLFMLWEKPGEPPVCIVNGDMNEIAWHLANIFKQNPNLWIDVNRMLDILNE